MHKRLERENKTVHAMIQIYCRRKHLVPVGICKECAVMMDYTTRRLEACPFQERKTTCVNCPVHCYEATMKEKIREIMRFSGPKMLTRHPYLSVRHIVDGFQKKSGRKQLSKV